MAKHNKKRNVGLLHEQLIRFASQNLVEGNKGKANLAIDILNNTFKEGTELYKEFRLFNALVHTSVPTKELAQQIISESRLACINHCPHTLRSEKSNLIKEINHSLDSSNFYGRKISQYKVFATVQALLNEWRGAQKLGPEEIVKYENLLESWLVREVDTSGLDKNPDANPLTLKIMIEKFNKKYKTLLNDEQRALLESCLEGDDKMVEVHVENIKRRAKDSLQAFYLTCDNAVLIEKRKLVEKRIMSLTHNTTDETIAKAMMISSLINEMEGSDDV